VLAVVETDAEGESDADVEESPEVDEPEHEEQLPPPAA